MLAYKYDTETKEYVGKITAQLDPLESKIQGKEIYLLPANSTFEKPPVTGDKEIVIFENNNWIKKADYRDDVFYDTATQERHEIKEIGIIPLENWTDKAPTDNKAVWNGNNWEIPFAVKKERKTAEIQSKSNTLMAETKKTYTDGEISTFEQQHAGATDILNGDELTTNAIFVIALLTGRVGHTPTADEKTAFAERIISNYTAAAVATAEIVGKQQRLELAVRAATTEEELDEIKWEE